MCDGARLEVFMPGLFYFSSQNPQSVTLQKWQMETDRRLLRGKCAIMSDEWYTPRPILELALKLMGRDRITYDPCPRPGDPDGWPCADLFCDGSFCEWAARDEPHGV
jgi:hypothetical protein